MVKVDMNGVIKNLMKVNGIKEESMDLGFGEAKMENPSLDSGKMERLQAMVFIHGLMETAMRGNGKIILNMEAEQKSSQTVIFMLVIIDLANQMALESIHGLTGALMKAIS